MKLMLGIASVLLVGCGAPVSAPVADGAPCNDVEVVFARGTNEPAGLGATGQSFVDALRAKTEPSSMGVYAVDYPATTAFVSSYSAGADDASARVQSIVTNCPGTRIVLGGYSQGASVIDTITGTLPPNVADHVAAVAVFGNPRGPYAASLINGPLPVIGPLYSAKTIDQCLPDDGICGAGWNPFAHDMYPFSGSTQHAADWVAGRL